MLIRLSVWFKKSVLWCGNRIALLMAVHLIRLKNSDRSLIIIFFQTNTLTDNALVIPVIPKVEIINLALDMSSWITTGYESTCQCLRLNQIKSIWHQIFVITWFLYLFFIKLKPRSTLKLWDLLRTSIENP